MEWPRQDLLKFVASIVGWQDAEDIVQDVAVKLLTHEPLFPNAFAARGWIFRVAKHAAIDHLRRTQVYAHVSLSDTAELPALYDPTDERERLWDTSRILATLTAEECDWLAAYAFYGSFEAAGLALDIPKETLRDRIGRIRELLKQTEGV